MRISLAHVILATAPLESELQFRTSREIRETVEIEVESQGKVQENKLNY